MPLLSFDEEDLDSDGESSFLETSEIILDEIRPEGY
jgi:hypothetical protein